MQMQCRAFEGAKNLLHTSFLYSRKEQQKGSKRNNLLCELRITDTVINQVQKFNYLGSMITSDGRRDTEIKKRIGTVKDAFQK